MKLEPFRAARELPPRGLGPGQGPRGALRRSGRARPHIQRPTGPREFPDDQAVAALEDAPSRGGRARMRRSAPSSRRSSMKSFDAEGRASPAGTVDGPPDANRLISGPPPRRAAPSGAPPGSASSPPPQTCRSPQGVDPCPQLCEVDGLDGCHPGLERVVGNVHRHGAGGLGCDRRGVSRVVPLRL